MRVLPNVKTACRLHTVFSFRSEESIYLAFFHSDRSLLIVSAFYRRVDTTGFGN